MADTKKIIHCPACNSEMEKVFIESAGINIDVCANGCGGMLFDNRELEKFDEKHENADKILEITKDKDFITVDQTKPRICPVCNAPMVKMGAGKGNVKIDVCNVCGAKFLDHGELLAIRDASNEEYEETAKEKVFFENLEKDALQETVGSLGIFVKNNISASNGSKAIADFIRKYV